MLFPILIRFLLLDWVNGVIDASGLLTRLQTRSQATSTPPAASMTAILIALVFQCQHLFHIESELAIASVFTANFEPPGDEIAGRYFHGWGRGFTSLS
jgi:hypothetical protein